MGEFSEPRRPLDRERAELALQVARLGEFEWDLATDQLFISDRMQAILGVTADAAQAPAGQRAARWIHPDDLAANQAATE